MLSSLPNRRTDNQTVRRAAGQAHSYPGNSATRRTFGLLAPPMAVRTCVVSMVAADSEGPTDSGVRQADLGLLM